MDYHLVSICDWYVDICQTKSMYVPCLNACAWSEAPVELVANVPVFQPAYVNTGQYELHPLGGIKLAKGGLHLKVSFCAHLLSSVHFWFFLNTFEYNTFEKHACDDFILFIFKNSNCLHLSTSCMLHEHNK